jgi:hypothetical protein
MNFIEHKNNLAYLLEMIEKGQCISTSKMAQKLSVALEQLIECSLNFETMVQR